MSEKLPKTSKELSNAIYDDFKRKAIDDAKKRAVAQHCDYETFKNMVSVAHLRPLHAPSIKQQTDTTMMPAWEFGADGTRRTAVEAMDGSTRLESAAPTSPPEAYGDFQREWRRNCKTHEEKYRYLQLCTPALLRTLFKVEVSADILADVIQTLDSSWMAFAVFAEEDSEGSLLLEAVFVMEVLSAVSEAGRFALTTQLLPGKVKESAKSLFEKLSGAVDAAEGQSGEVLSQASLTKLRAQYGVKS